MHKVKHLRRLFFLFTFLYFISSHCVGVAGENPFSPKAYLKRYWNKKISNNLPHPSFLINKASPLTAVESATYTKLATQNALSTKITSFCSSAKLLCFLDGLEKHDQDVNFSVYEEKNFTNYGTKKISGVDSFKNYAGTRNIPVDSFQRYSRGSVGHNDRFSNYAPRDNVANESFNSYGTTTTGGTGEFKSYAHQINVPDLRFTSYSADSTGRKQEFTSYSDEGNSGSQTFTSYSKDGAGAGNDFINYTNNSNVIRSDFSSYSEHANRARATGRLTTNVADNNFKNYGSYGNNPENNFKNYAGQGNDLENNFKNYAAHANNPRNNFKNYGEGGKAIVDSFTNYRDQSTAGDDSFESYAKVSDGVKEVKFTNYGKSIYDDPVKFATYGTHGATGQKIGFKTYGINNTFKDYQDKKSISFAEYTKNGSAKMTTISTMGEGKTVNHRVEPGKFFREMMLKTGVIMPMPDIRDKMPQRSFLPRVILSQLPFTSSKVNELKQIFQVSENSSMAGRIMETLSECERAPARDETKRCVGSVEDMIDFATSVLGRNVVVRTTETTKGSKQNVMLGSVKAINGGKVTKSVSCHQSMFPYLLYYCHSVPKVRVYLADIFDPKSKSKINHGVAICHVDTSSWSASHGAFVALGSGPGKIEVCHWIFENDMTWAIAD